MKNLHFLFTFALFSVANCMFASADTEDTVVSVRPTLTEGKYRIVSALQGFLDRGVRKAIYASTDHYANWNDLDTTSLAYVWDFKFVKESTDAETGEYYQYFTIQNLFTGEYMSPTNFNQHVNLAEVTDEIYVPRVKWLGMGEQFNIELNAVNDPSYWDDIHAQEHLGGSGTSGALVIWDAGYGSASAWTLESIAEDELKQIEEATAQQLLNNKLSTLLDKANEGLQYIWNNDGFVLNRETPLLTSAEQITTNALEPHEGSIAALIDGDGQTFFHSTWSSSIPDAHYLQFALVDPVGVVTFDLTRRLNQNYNYNNFPETMEIATSEDGEEFTTVKTISGVTIPERRRDSIPSTSVTVTFDAPTKYIRMTVTETAPTPAVYFTLGELQLYPVAFEAVGVFDHETVPALQAAVDKAETIGLATQADIDELQSAYDAFAAVFSERIYFNVTLQTAIDKLQTFYNDQYSYLTSPIRNEISSVIHSANSVLQGDEYDSMVDAYNSVLAMQTKAEENHRLYVELTAAYERMTNAYNTFNSILYQDAIDAYNEARNEYNNNRWNLENGGLAALIHQMSVATDMLVGKIEDPIYAAAKDTIIVHVDEMGTLGEKVLMQADYLTSSFYLVLSGKLNDSDASTIRSLTNLQGIDMSGVDMEAMPNELFRDRATLLEVILPANLRTIGNYAFYNCKKLREVRLPQTVKSIGNYAFEGCRSLKTIALNEGLETIGDYAFRYATSLSQIKFPFTLKTVGGYAFYQCYYLTDAVIPEGVTQLGNYSFAECDRLSNVSLPSTLKTISSCAFRSCDALATVDFSEGLETIGSSAFYYCHQLTSINLPKTLKRIESNAFGDCNNLREVTIPASVIYCYRAFESCENMLSITCLAALPPYSDSYNYGPTGATLYVPSLALISYKLDAYWKQFSEILPVDVMPEVINVYNDYRLLMPDSLPADYKPVVNLVRNPDDDYQYGTLTVVGNEKTTLSMKSFMMDYDPNRFVDYYDAGYYSDYESSNSLISRSPMRADSIFMNLYLKNNRWAFLSFPYDVKVSDITPVGNTSWVIREYLGAARANGYMDSTWVNVPEDDILEAGKGYIWHSVRPESSYTHFIVPALDNANKNKIFAKDDCTVTLAEYPSEFSHNRSWNLIGNPYPCFYDSRFMDFSAPITIWNDYNRTYEAYSLVDDSRILRPGEAFFVQRPVDSEAIVFSTEGRQVDRYVREMEISEVRRLAASANREVFNLFLGNGENTDKTRFVINSLADISYDASTDASKFMSSDRTVAQIYTIENGVEMSINERPLGNGVITLGAYFGTTGTYTITLDTKADRQIVLVDKFTGTRTDLTQGGYEFTAEPGRVTNRFEIIVSNVNGDEATAIDATDDNATEVKVDGRQIVVNSANMADIFVYTVDGKTVSATKSTNATISVEPGVYVIKVAGKIYKQSVK